MTTRPASLTPFVGSGEAALQAHVIEMAEQWLGWRVLHIRPGRTKHGWRTPVSGMLGKGWPDLLLAKRGRIVAAELKGANGTLEPEQRDVLDWLRLAGVETHVWRPADWPAIVACLSGEGATDERGTDTTVG